MKIAICLVILAAIVTSMTASATTRKLAFAPGYKVALAVTCYARQVRTRMWHRQRDVRERGQAGHRDPDGNTSLASEGECVSTPAPTRSPKTSSTESCDYACLDVYMPVTDEDGKRYPNECYMQLAKCKGGRGDNNKRVESPGLSALGA